MNINRQSGWYSELFGSFPDTSKEYYLALEYEYECESYDRSVCNVDYRGRSMPWGRYQMSAINHNARIWRGAHRDIISAFCLDPRAYNQHRDEIDRGMDFHEQREDLRRLRAEYHDDAEEDEGWWQTINMIVSHHLREGRRRNVPY